jgi:hypothetical protein
MSPAVMDPTETEDAVPEAPSKKATRFSITFDLRSLARLERMASDAEGKAEVIRQALALEELYRETVSKGGSLLIRRADGTIAEVVRP